MTRQEKIEELQDKVRHNFIGYLDDLKLGISCAEYDGDGTIDEYDDVLSPMEWNCCDLCGALYPSEEMCWTDYLDYEYDKELMEALKMRGEDVCAVCYECVKQLKEK